tara:strand:+ start:899 stop:1045 length:147 start_codon:yes stop_codon:yes gene_type:complete
MKQDLESKINYLQKELANRGSHGGWIVEGLRKELERLKAKVKKTKIKK